MLCQECLAVNLNGARFCSSCGTRLAEEPMEAPAPRTRLLDPQLAGQPAVASQQPLLEPQPAQQSAVALRSRLRNLLPRRSTKRGWFKTCLMASASLFGLVAVCGIFGAIASDGDSHAARGRDSEYVAIEDESEFLIPEQQAAFIQTVESFYEPYQEAENELRASAQRSKRREALAALLPDGAVKDWTGTLESLDTNSDGDAYVTIRPHGTEAITIVTWNTVSADTGANTLIPSGSALYDELAEMSVGDQVVFSGAFVGSDQDHAEESSETEAESMTEPDFVMALSEVTHESEVSEEE